MSKNSLLGIKDGFTLLCQSFVMENDGYSDVSKFLSFGWAHYLCS